GGVGWEWGGSVAGGVGVVWGASPRGRQRCNRSRTRRDQRSDTAQRPPQSCWLASRAPSASDLNFAHTMLGCTSFDPAKVAKPQPAPAITLSPPPTLAYRPIPSPTLPL